MCYEEFKRRMKSLLAEEFDGDVRIREFRTYRTNLGRGDMVSVHAGKEGGVLCPALCVQEYYGQYQRGAALKDMVASVVVECRKSFAGEGSFALLGDLMDYGKVRERVYFRIVHGERNREMLSDAPHVDFLDLSIAFYVLVSAGDADAGSVLVDGRLMEKWISIVKGGISKEELSKQAVENTPGLFPVKACSLSDALRERIVADGGDDGLDEFFERRDKNYWVQPYLMTNEMGLYGFSAVLYPGTLGGMAEKLGSDLFVLPSSIHEAILVPRREGMDAEDFRQMVRAVNRQAVLPGIFLSNEVYLFEREGDRLRFAE